MASCRLYRRYELADSARWLYGLVMRLAGSEKRKPNMLWWHTSRTGGYGHESCWCEGKTEEMSRQVHMVAADGVAVDDVAADGIAVRPMWPADGIAVDDAVATSLASGMCLSTQSLFSVLCSSLQPDIGPRYEQISCQTADM
ncbi:uncharacterized protein YALI1_B06207g [Yarrowia lipolytica]|uniref:Uncharacterized protein n=1 Tax=Yarrowia lipolytica TaxID=4952 RepID=A0A1D8N6F9_YARLL|nr:hypothetical protein YALI1_B06207g [Yarrowia lipolytica]